MSVKIFVNFFLSSGGYNLKINYLKDKMRHRMCVHILLKKIGVIPIAKQVLLLAL